MSRPGEERVALAVDAFKRGEPALFYSELRDIAVAAVPGSRVDGEAVNLLVRECRGLLYAALPAAQVKRLGLREELRSGPYRRSMVVPVDYRLGVTTGISAEERAATIRALLSPVSDGSDFRMPGHVTPISVGETGLFGRWGIAEAVLTVSQEAGDSTGVAFCGVLAPDGTDAGLAEVGELAARFGFPLVDIASCISFLRQERGWQEPPLLVRDLSNIDSVAVIRAKGSKQRRERFPVDVWPACVRGRELGHSCCGDRRRRSVEQLDLGAPGAAIAVVPSAGVARCDRPLDQRIQKAIARLVAADLCAAVAVPFN